MVAYVDESVLEFLDNNNKDDFDVDIRHRLDVCFQFLSLHTHCNSFLSGHWVYNVWYTRVI